MIKIIKGDLLGVKHGIIAHQVNCMGKMGSGVALQIKNKYPQAYSEYVEIVSEYYDLVDLRHVLLGATQFVEVEKNLFVANLFGQHQFGNDGKKYTDEMKLFESLKKLRTFAEQNNLPVYMPYLIGCGLGNGDWKTVEDLILKAFDGYEVTLCKL